MNDASFRDGRETSLKLIAHDEADLLIVSAMAQDAIAQPKEMLFESTRKTFSLLLNRFRWEDVDTTDPTKNPLERVQSILLIQSTLAVKYRGFDVRNLSLAFDLIGISSEENLITLAFAGGAEIMANVECIDIILTDVSKPYKAKIQILPQHVES